MTPFVWRVVDRGVANVCDVDFALGVDGVLQLLLNKKSC